MVFDQVLHCMQSSYISFEASLYGKALWFEFQCDCSKLKVICLCVTGENVPFRSSSMEALTVSNDEFADARSVLSSESGNYYEPCHEEKLSSGFPTRFDTNPAVQPQKMARGLKFRI